MASDLADIVRVGSDFALSLNVSKSELTPYSDLQVRDPLLQAFIGTEIINSVLLGAPLFQGTTLYNQGSSRTGTHGRHQLSISEILLRTIRH